MTEAQVMTLAQWLSPAFPIGAYAYSHGLEGAVDCGWVTDGDSLERWLIDVLELGSGQADARLLAAAYHAEHEEQIREIDAIARALCASKERLLETVAQGAAFGKAVAVWGIEIEDLSYSVGLGHAAARQELPLNLTQKLYLQAFVSNLLAAGQRLLPVGQQEALNIQNRLSARCAAVAEKTRDGDLDKLSATALMTDVAAMRHETQYSRIFRT